MSFPHVSTSSRLSLRRFSVLLVGLLCLGAACATPEAPVEPASEPRPALPEFQVFGEPASPEDSEAIQSLLGQFSTAWSNSDAAAVAALYADDAEWTNAFGDVVRGPADLERFLSRMFSQFDSAVSGDEQSNSQRVSMWFLGDDAAITHSVTISRRGMEPDEPGERRVHITFVLGKRDGTWKIVHQMIMDARQ
jgi:uncharacterized protein (TIGR02246 family)